MLETESYKCPKCQGIGNLSRWVYIREKGTPTQRILQSIRCEECNGTGAVTITTEVLRSLHAFANAANGIIVAIRDFNRSLNDFASP
jgi:phage FluMu protein Com